MSLLRCYRVFVAHPDPVAAAANGIAMLILSNQPFYPLYIYLLAGDRFWPSLLTLLSSPLFALVPWLMRRNATAGKSLLMAASIGNTLVSIKALGAETGLELFFFPCAVLGALIFDEKERKLGWFFAILPIVLFFVLRGRYGAPYETFSGAELSTFVTLHAISAAAIAVFVCFTVAAALRKS